MNRKRAGWVVGLIVLVFFTVLPIPDGMPREAWYVACIGIVMATLWIAESLPFVVTALLPVVLFPIAGVADISETTAPYANSIIFLFIGGILIALGMERSGLHRRMALWLLARSGSRPSSIIAGLLVATAFLSMWINNTSTAVMMLPIGMSVYALLAEKSDSASPALPGVAIMLAIAYGANIGGFFTLIGTAPNALFAGFLAEEYNYHVGFLQWMMFTMPFGIVLLAGVWICLTRWTCRVSSTHLPGADEKMASAFDALGRMSCMEKVVASVFCTTALLWMLRPLLPVPGLSDPLISMLGGLSLFFIRVPADREPGSAKEPILDAEILKKIPWDVLILIGGGLSLAFAVKKSGLAEFIGNAMGQFPLPSGILLIVIFAAVILVLTEFTSNTATTAAFLPILGALAVGLGENPVLFTAVAAVAASGAFMLPVATPPNAIVFSGGLVTVPQMMRAGIVINLLMLFLLAVAADTYGRIIFQFPAVP